MGYFAKINGSNVVEDVIVADQAFVDAQEGTFVETDINGVSPKNYAGIGMTWDSGRNAFIPVKPFPSWVLNETTCQWEAPVAMPNDGQRYNWNEGTQEWDLLT